MEDGSTVEITGSGENYTATVTKEDQSTVVAIPFRGSRETGEDVGTYAITPEATGETPTGYRVLFVPGTLTISKAEVTITAGATKVYGDVDPAVLITITLNDEPVQSVEGLVYSAEREEGEDVGTYQISLTGEADQGN